MDMQITSVHVYKLRVTPLTFDKIITKIIDDPVFQNNSHSPQAPVEEQLAVTLYCFGHDGNAASLQNIANWAGLGKGTVHKNEAVWLPTTEEKEAAKKWVESHSCKAWRHGWCFVDGTLIPLHNWPYWFGESYFDRKCNYSLNFQVINLPNLCIINFSYSQTGSIHDATAWEDTQICQEHQIIFEEGKWIWADSAYPVRKFSFAKFIIVTSHSFFLTDKHMDLGPIQKA
ncbi:hypothetical protein HYPSUDRAFT_69146 [Hypholoma sublateritium FD-334 SS-4]|uniref:DDE Tnp4 domain-containing protein n=1 Tax=Hypholoma sublateritium (strain FD-334 SS-4) TaxID=945553 RepID=A0A0D2M8E7_HYPSF|nr:hypothetical protein HYPSUDRAFT_69146 [Hypholoma sublateritium FD-334 SS-4]